MPTSKFKTSDALIHSLNFLARSSRQESQTCKKSHSFCMFARDRELYICAWRWWCRALKYSWSVVCWKGEFPKRKCKLGISGKVPIPIQHSMTLIKFRRQCLDRWQITLPVLYIMHPCLDILKCKNNIPKIFAYLGSERTSYTYINPVWPTG